MGASILIVDDNPVNLSVLRALLSKDAYDLVACDNGLSALDIVRNNPSFDLILIDVVMPGVDGIEVCRRLKKDPATAYIPIVLISAYRTDDSSIREGLAAGADGYLTQPIEDMALRSWVKATLRISALQRELIQRSASAERPNAAEVYQRFARLSHDVNSPLQALYAGADLLSLDLEHNVEAQELIRGILENAERVTSLVAEASQLAKGLLK